MRFEWFVARRYLRSPYRPAVLRLVTAFSVLGVSAGVATLVIVKKRQIVQRLSDIGMIGAERFLSDRQRALVERLGVGVATLASVKPRQIVQRRGDYGIFGTESFLSDRQRSLVERLGIGVATLFFVAFGLIGQRRRKDGRGGTTMHPSTIGRMPARSAGAT